MSTHTLIICQCLINGREDPRMLRGSTGAKVDRAPEAECALIKQVQERLFKHLDPV